MLSNIPAWAHAHWQAIMYVVAGWTVIATLIGRKWPKPAASAKWYAKAGHFLLVDWPAWLASQNGKTYLGFKISLPFITWTVSDPNEKQKLGALLPLLLLPALLVSGCSWEPIDPMTGLTIALIAGGGCLALLVARALALRSAALVLALLSAFVALPGCATPFGKAYSGCVKSATSTAFAANAQNIPAQAEAILSAALSANWVAAGLDLLLDLVKDTGAEAVVVCVVTAWQAAHPLPANASPPPALATAHAGANQFLAAHPAAVKASSCARVRF